jgi:hypothetical protein
MELSPSREEFFTRLQGEYAGILERRSKTLKESPKAKLDQCAEVEAYFGRQNEEHLNLIRSLAAQTEPMTKDCHLSICIPVAGHEEEKNIWTTLDAFRRQTAIRTSYEIVLFVNHPDVDSKGNKIGAESVLKEIESFVASHPEEPIRVMRQTLERDRITIGGLRKMVFDAVLWRHFQRGERAPQLIMVSTDADVEDVSPKYVEYLSNKFDREPEIDAIVGSLDWDKKVYLQNPAIHIGVRLMQYLSRLRHGPLPGANFALRASIYAAVGGFDEKTDFAEDVGLMKAIVIGRSGRGSIVAGGRDSRLATSARRIIGAHNQNLPPISQWDVKFGVFEPDLRKERPVSGLEVPDYNNLEQKGKIIKNIERIINQTLDVAEKRWFIKKDSSVVRRALRLLGIKTRMVGREDGDGTRYFIIENTDELLERIRTYAEKNKNGYLNKERTSSDSNRNL